MKLIYNSGNRPKVKAETLYSMFKKIERKHGELKPEHLLNEARKKSHPLHDWFEWDDKVAAEKYRLEQARKLIITVYVEFENKEKNRVERVRAFSNVMRTEDGELTMSFRNSESSYVSTETVLEDEDLRQYTLKRAMMELNSFKRKYSGYEEFASVIEAIDEVLMAEA